MNPSVGIVVLNWNGENVIEDCLNSLENIKYDNYRIIVIDNASTDDLVSIIKNNFQKTELIKLDKNYGFADGYNKGIESIKTIPEFLILLNNDTEVDTNFVEPLIEPLMENNDIGQTVPKILYANDRKNIWYAGGIVNLWLGRIEHIGIRKIDSSELNKSRETDYATGCCFAMRYKDFVDIGGFDTSFPMYCEDVDLSLRIWELGQSVKYFPESKIWHKVSASIGGEFSYKKIHKKFYGYINLFNKHANIFQKLTILLIWFISLPYFLLRILYHRLFRYAKK